jgi:hypothetical protein
MLSAIAIASFVFCVAFGAAVVLMRRRRVGFSSLENVSVSRQWLIQHQGDDRS